MLIEQIKAIVKVTPNDQDLGKQLKSLINKFSEFEEVCKYLKTNVKGYDVKFSNYPFSIRFDYWVRATSEIEKYLFDNGFELDILDDEDCGRLYSYNLKN